MIDMKITDQVEKLGALLMVIVAMAVLSYLSVQGNEQSQGALIAVVSAGTGYFLRGRVEKGD